MKNTAKEVMDLISSLMENKKQQLEEIQEMLCEERKAEADAQAALDAAAAALDYEAHCTAKAALAHAVDCEEMLDRRLNQLASAKLVPEEESDKVIGSLLQYEQDLEKSFEDNVAALLAALKDAMTKHKDAVDEAEGAIHSWTQNIHPNYRSRGITRYANGTDRADHPVPVRTGIYVGGNLWIEVRDFLDKRLIKELLRVHACGMKADE